MIFSIPQTGQVTCLESDEVESYDDDLNEEDASEQGRKSNKTKSMFKDTVPVTIVVVSLSISTIEPRTPPTTAATAFIDEDLTIAQTLVKMRSEKAKEKLVAFRDFDVKFKGQNGLPDPELAKQLATEKAEAIRNKPPTRVQVRNMMITYLKHMGKYTHQQLKHKTLEDLPEALLPKRGQKVDIMTLKPMDSEEDLAVVPDEDEIMDPEILPVKFEDNTPEGYNLLLWGDLKVMFEPNAEDEIWIEKRYPLIKEMLKKMLNWKLEAEAESTMAFEILKFIKSQGRIVGNYRLLQLSVADST
ncbi:hypothetical protein Tco_0264933 [Tanacetum coccineum]